jgi:hypothetical protein
MKKINLKQRIILYYFNFSFLDSNIENGYDFSGIQRENRKGFRTSRKH